MNVRHSAILIGLVSSTFIGCATIDELDAAKASMRASLGATKQSLEGRIRQLEDTKKKWEDQQTHLAKAIKSQEEASARIAELENVTLRELAELRMVWQREKGALVQMLDAEEAVYRAGLLSIQRARTGLLSAERNGMTGMQIREMSNER
jgi:hypothetical protein